MRVRWLKKAISDLDEAMAYIAQDDPEAATSVTLRVVWAVSLLKEQPGIGLPGRVPGTKELIVQNTPFVVPYRVKDDTVQIIRVYHSYRIWPERL